MQIIKKVFEDQKLDFTEFQDFIVSALEFSKKFNDDLKIGDFKLQIKVSKSALRFYAKDKKEYLESILDFLDGFNDDMSVLEYKEHLQSALDHINTHKGDEMKKGFTMIELIFVIVILGILAAIAIPRLTATRDDAKVTAAKAENKQLLKDLGAYYTSQGDFNTSIDKLTNVSLTAQAEATGLNTAFTNGGGDLVYKIDDDDCVLYSLTSSDGNVTIASAPLTNSGLCADLFKVLDFNGTSRIFGGTRVKF